MNITDFDLGVTDLHTDDSTWLRGMWPTDAEGMMEMKTIFPGFYVERAIHIHTEVYMNWTLASNGTVKAGNIANVGQLFCKLILRIRLPPLHRILRLARYKNPPRCLQSPIHRY
jgi:hypothetical protein